MKYATIDANGLPTGFYSKEVHGDKIPADAIEISDKDWRAHISGDLRRWNGSAWEPYVPPPPPLDEIKAQARRQVKQFADEIGQRLTEAYPQSEVLSWPRKADVAERWLADTSQPVPVIIQQEADLVGQSAVEVAQTIVDRARFYEQVAGAMAGLRRKTIAAIDAATTAEEVKAALEAGKQEAEQIMQELGIA